jgi:hypothetical protein
VCSISRFSMTRRYAKTRLLSLLALEALSARFAAASVRHKKTYRAKDSTALGHVEVERVDIVRLRRELKVS